MGGVFNRFSLVLAILVSFVGINATSKAFAAAGSITVHKGDMDNVPEQTLTIVKSLELKNAIITSNTGCFYTKKTKKAEAFLNNDITQILAHHDKELGKLSLTWENVAVDSNNEICNVNITFSNFNYPDGRPDKDTNIITEIEHSNYPNELFFGPCVGIVENVASQYRSLTADAELSFITSSGKAASGVYPLSFRDLDQVNKDVTNTECSDN